MSIDELIRGDTELMDQLTVADEEDVGPVGRVIYGGLFWGVIGFLATWALGLDYQDTAALLQLPIVLVFIALLLTIYANQ
uniref:hypothetical protein n=1 Tax=Levilactobacillus cerevisiae TaxID=1704076 RepID=UPI003F57FBB6